MNLPSAHTLVKAVAITAAALVIINVVKPYLPVSVQKLLTA